MLTLGWLHHHSFPCFSLVSESGFTSSSCVCPTLEHGQILLPLPSVLLLLAVFRGTFFCFYLHPSLPFPSNIVACRAPTLLLCCACPVGPAPSPFLLAHPAPPPAPLLLAPSRQKKCPKVTTTGFKMLQKCRLRCAPCFAWPFWCCLHAGPTWQTSAQM